MSIYFWGVNARGRAQLVAKDEYWRHVLFGLVPFPTNAYAHDPATFEEAIGSDVPVPGVLPLADFLNVDGYCRVMSPLAKESLGPELEECGDFYPIQIRRQPYWLFRPTAVVDCVDVESTRGRWHEGVMQRIHAPKFIPDRVPETLAFRVPQSRSQVFVGERFRGLVKQRKLKGIWLYQDDDDKGWRT